MTRRPLAGLPEVAAHFGLPEKSIRNQVHHKTGIGQFAFRVGKYLRWDWDDLDKWVESQKRSETV
jgi:hypothetical protein